MSGGMTAVVAGPDDFGLGDALADLGVDVVRLDGPATAESLQAAGVDDAELFVLTDFGEATAIPLAKEANPTIRVVAYTEGSLPEFVRGQTDLAIDPDLLGPGVVAEELI
ncbi:MAG: DUF7126 family protein [Halobacteriota archaeon]